MQNEWATRPNIQKGDKVPLLFISIWATIIIIIMVMGYGYCQTLELAATFGCIVAGRRLSLTQLNQTINLDAPET